MDKGKSPLVEEGHKGNGSSLTFIDSQTLHSRNFVQTAPVIGRFGYDLAGARENHLASIGHNRTQSEPFVPCQFDEYNEDLVSRYFDVDKFPSSLDGLGLGGNEMTAKTASSFHVLTPNPVKLSVVERQSIGLRSNQSVDESPSQNLSNLDSSLQCPPALAGRKFKAAARLAEAILVDPVKARRMISNRQSAARSREKARYLLELEQEVENLQKEATALSAHLRDLKRSSSALAIENYNLKMHQQKLEKDIMLQYALEKNLQEELRRLKSERAQFVVHGYNLHQVKPYSLHQQQGLLQPQNPPALLTNSGPISSQSQGEGNSDDSSSSNGCALHLHLHRDSGQGKNSTSEEVNGLSSAIRIATMDKGKVPVLEENEIRPFEHLKSGEAGNASQTVTSDVMLFGHNISVLTGNP